MGNIPSVSSGQLATADQYNALQAGLNPLVENDYTSWKLITNVATAAQSAYVLPANILMDEINNIIYFIDWDNSFMWSVNIDGSNLTRYPSTVLMEPYYFMNVIRSPLGKYILALNPFNTPITMAIFKNGSILQTITLDSFQFEAYSVNAIKIVSPNPFINRTGQYIVVVGPDASNDLVIRIQVYEGQS